jgi:hypothetical protein
MESFWIFDGEDMTAEEINQWAVMAILPNCPFFDT